MTKHDLNDRISDLGHALALILEAIGIGIFAYAYIEKPDDLFLLGIIVLIASAILSVVFAGFAIKKRIREQDELVRRTQALIEQQEKSGKMLIRRDLELSRANDRLRELDQLKSDFVTVATHQLRTPLSAMKWILSMLIKGDAGPLSEEQRTYLTKAYESNDRMTQLLNNMLLTDRVESDKLKVDTESTHIGDVFDSLITEIQPLADQKHITLDTHILANNNILVAVEPRLMRAILQNLLENAIKYTRNDGHVTLGIHDNGIGTVTFSVTDDGIGIPRDQQKKIFDRFYRTDNALKMVPDGSGLGLFIVKRIVERSRGKIWFESQEGKGTTFFVELPTVADLTK